MPTQSFEDVLKLSKTEILARNKVVEDKIIQQLTQWIPQHGKKVRKEMIESGKKWKSGTQRWKIGNHTVYLQLSWYLKL